MKNKKSFLESLLDESTPKRVGSFKEVKGDLIQRAYNKEFGFIAHGANCFKSMGAGIAKQIAIDCPAMRAADLEYPLTASQRLGNYSYAEELIDDKHSFIGLNIYSQFLPGNNFDREALIVALRKFCIDFHDSVFEENIYLQVKNKYKIGLPLIGCGIGGGEWEDVKKIIQTELSEFDVTIVHFSK